MATLFHAAPAAASFQPVRTPHYHDIGPDARSPLPRHNFPLFLGARFFGVLGTMILSVAVGWHVYEITRDPLALGYVGLAQFLPMVLLTLPAGQVADMVNRRFIILATSALQAAVAGGFLFLTLEGIQDVGPYYALLTVFGSAGHLPGPPDSRFCRCWSRGTA